MVVAMAQTAPEPLEMPGSSQAFRSTQAIRALKSSCRRRHARGNAGGYGDRRYVFERGGWRPRRSGWNIQTPIASTAKLTRAYDLAFDEVGAASALIESSRCNRDFRTTHGPAFCMGLCRRIGLL